MRACYPKGVHFLTSTVLGSDVWAFEGYLCFCREHRGYCLVEFSYLPLWKVSEQLVLHPSHILVRFVQNNCGEYTSKYGWDSMFFPNLSLYVLNFVLKLFLINIENIWWSSMFLKFRLGLFLVCFKFLTILSLDVLIKLFS